MVVLLLGLGTYAVTMIKSFDYNDHKCMRLSLFCLFDFLKLRLVEKELGDASSLSFIESRFMWYVVTLFGLFSMLPSLMLISVGHLDVSLEPSTGGLWLTGGARLELSNATDIFNADFVIGKIKGVLLLSFLLRI
jgi:hypothetical protein